MTAALWAQSGVPYINKNGAPFVGMKAYFEDSGTTTPRTVYRDPELSTPHDRPVVTNSFGLFPPVYLPSGAYKFRLLEPDDTPFFEADGVIVPTDEVAQGGGSVDPKLLVKTGAIQGFLADSVTGWVRANGKTIGSASSGATERANDDTESLFAQIWGLNRDSVFPISGGRGVSAASDFAADKTIKLLDTRGRSIIGCLGMGNSVLSLIPSSLFDNGGTGNAIGDTVGVGEVTLTIAQLAGHSHGGATLPSGGHSHTYTKVAQTPLLRGRSGNETFVNTSNDVGTFSTSTQPDHTHGIATQGGDEAHPNVQPSVCTNIFIKL